MGLFIVPPVVVVVVDVGRLVGLLVGLFVGLLVGIVLGSAVCGSPVVGSTHSVEVVIGDAVER